MTVGIPTIYNITLVNTNTEYSQSLNSSFPGSFLVQARNADVYMYFISTASPVTTYITIFNGSSYFINLQMAGFRTLYFQSTVANAVVEILEWR